MRLGRLTLLLVPIALGGVLVLNGWSSRHRVAEATEVLVRGQLSEYFRSYLAGRQRRDGPPTVTDLDPLLAEHGASGLRYAALIANDGSVLASVGAPSPEPEAPFFDDVSIPLTRRGERVRAALPPPRRSSDAPSASRSSTLVFEFEPVVGNRLYAEATRSLQWSALAAAVLCLSSFAAWRLLRRHERERERLERERRLTALGEMSAVLAHEIRNPLASLKGTAQLLREQMPDDSKQRRKVDRIVDEAVRLEALSSTLLDFVRSGSVAREPVDTLSLVTSSADTVAPERVQVKSDGAAPSWSLDPLRMRQVVTNLIENAVHASPAGTPIDVRVGTSNDLLTITVRDRGPGLGGGRDAIFDAFHTTRTKGSGLGLTIARRIVEMHGGTLQAKDHPDGGALFEVAVPR